MFLNINFKEKVYPKKNKNKLKNVTKQLLDFNSIYNIIFSILYIIVAVLNKYLFNMNVVYYYIKYKHKYYNIGFVLRITVFWTGCVRCAPLCRFSTVIPPQPQAWLFIINGSS